MAVNIRKEENPATKILTFNQFTLPLTLVAMILTGALVYAAWPYLPLYANIVIATATATVPCLAALLVQRLWIANKMKQKEIELAEERAYRLLVNQAGAEGYINPRTGVLIEPKLIQPVPTSLHYSPPLKYDRQAALTQDVPVALPPMVTPELPSSVDLLPALQRLLGQGAINRSQLDLYLGESANGPIILSLHNAMHTGLLGKSGAGKSAQQRSIITQLYLSDPQARRVTFNLFDLEGRELKLFRDLPNTRFYTEDEREADQKIAELRERLEQLCKLDEEEIEGMPYELLVIEELLDFRQSLSDKGRENLDKLLRRGRKCHLYTMGASQLFQTAEVGRSIKQMMATRLCFRTEAESAAAFGFKRDVLEVLTQPGRFAFDLPVGKGIAQAPFISAQQVKALLPSIGVTRPAVTPSENWQSAAQVSEAASKPSQPSDYERAKTAMASGATSVEKLEKALGISHRQAYKLYKQLQEDRLL